MVEPGSFAAATALRPIDVVDGAGAGALAADIPEGWDILGNVDGGLLLAILGRALTMATGRPDPITVTGHYLSPGRAGPAEVHTELIRTGRRFATARATLTAGGRPVLAALGTTGTLGPPDEVLHVDGGPPDLPAPEDCELLVGGDGFPPSFTDRVVVRLHPDDTGFMHGSPSGTPRVRGWFRLLDDEPVDTIGLLLAVDALPPTIFNAALPAAWTPTVELTAHIRARPAPGWLACDFRTRFVTGGLLEVDGEVWDATGSLVAQSRQLALVPRG